MHLEWRKSALYLYIQDSIALGQISRAHSSRVVEHTLIDDNPHFRPTLGPFPPSAVLRNGIKRGHANPYSGKEIALVAPRKPFMRRQMVFSRVSKGRAAFLETSAREFM